MSVNLIEWSSKISQAEKTRQGIAPLTEQIDSLSLKDAYSIQLEQVHRKVNEGELNETVERMSRTMGDLQNIVLTMRMVPVETVFNRFPKMVRQLSRDLNKKIALNVVGAETELDRTVIDEIGDPLVHLIRNSVDHGIESPDVRRAKGKPEEGTVELRAYHSGNYVFIEIEDDGAGINRNIYVMSEEERKANGIDNLPAALDDALALLAKDEVIQKALGES